MRVVLELTASLVENCPVAWAGQYKDKKPTDMLDAICDAMIFIWSVLCGHQRYMNNLRRLDYSTTLELLLTGNIFPEFTLEFIWVVRRLCHYLMDFIYLK